MRTAGRSPWPALALLRLQVFPEPLENPRPSAFVLPARLGPRELRVREHDLALALAAREELDGDERRLPVRGLRDPREGELGRRLEQRDLAAVFVRAVRTAHRDAQRAAQ